MLIAVNVKHPLPRKYSCLARESIVAHLHVRSCLKLSFLSIRSIRSGYIMPELSCYTVSPYPLLRTTTPDLH